MANTAEAVVVLLEHVRVDGADAQPELGGVLGQLPVVVDPVPRDMESYRGGHPGQPMNEGGVFDLLVRVTGRGRVTEHLEPCTGVAVSPRRRLDPLPAQLLLDFVM